MEPITVVVMTAMLQAAMEVAVSKGLDNRVTKKQLEQELDTASKYAVERTIKNSHEPELARAVIFSLHHNLKPEVRQRFEQELFSVFLLSKQPDIKILVTLCERYLPYRFELPNNLLPENSAEIAAILQTLFDNFYVSLLDQPTFAKLLISKEILRTELQQLDVQRDLREYMKELLTISQQHFELEAQNWAKTDPSGFYSDIELPLHHVSREAVLKDLRELLLSTDNTPIVIHGIGGSGKSVIARAICEDVSVQQRYSRILFTQLDYDSDPFTNLSEWVKWLGGKIDPAIKSTRLLKLQLSSILEDQHVLFIVDNAWRFEDVDAFNLRNVKCRLLVTTRHQEIADRLGIAPFDFPQEMLPSEAQELLLNWAETKLVNTSNETIVRIIANLGRLPLAIELAGGQLTDFRGTADEWISEFEARSSRYSQDIYGKLANVFELSLQQLSYDDRALFIALAIFKKDELIREIAISRLWSGMGNVSQRDVEFLINKLSSVALIKIDRSQSSPMLRLHAIIHELMLNELGTDSVPSLHRALVDGYRGSLQEGSGWHTLHDDGYIYHQLVHHLCECGAIEEAEHLFLSQYWTLRQLEIGNYRYDNVMTDIELIWQKLQYKALEETNGFESFESCFRFALIRTSINSIAETLSPTVINAAIEHGIWTTDAAISIVQRTSDPSSRLEICIALLVERDDLSSNQQLILHGIFFETIQIFSDYSTVVNALQKISARLHPEYVDQALLLVKGIVFLSNRMEGLATLLPLFSNDQQEQLLLESIEEISLENDELDKGRALAALAPHLTADLIPTAIELIANLRGHYERSSTITALVNNADEQQIRQLYQIARAIRDGKERARAVTALADYLPYELVDDAITAVSDVDEIYSRIQSQVKLAPYIDPDRQDSIFRTILEDIRNNNNTFTRCDFALRSSPMGLYEQLPDKYQIEAIKCCFETGLMVASGWHRAQAFALALFRICQRDDISEFTDMFERAFYELVHLALATFTSLSELVAYLPEHQARIATKTILEQMDLPVSGEDERQKNQNRKDRTVWVTRILPLLSAEDRTKTLDKIFEVAFSLPKQKDVLEVINSVVPFLKKAELQGIISRLSQIQDKNSRAGALSRIALHLPKSSQTEILEQVLREYLPQMLTDNEKAFIIARISALLEDKQLHHCLALINEFTAETAKAIALANIARNVTNPPVAQIYNLATTLTDNEAKALIIEALADKITPHQIDECMSFVISLSNVEQKTKILSSFARSMPKEQVYRCFNEILLGEHEVIKIVIAASLVSELDLQDREQFLAKAVDTIWSTEIGRSQFGIIWGITSIAPYLDEQPRDRMLGYALHLFSTMPGNHASYPSGNPKTNIAKKLIPFLCPEMQIRILDEIRTIPRLGSLAGEDSSPLAQVLEETAQTLSEAALPTVLNLLNETEDGWDKTHSLESIAENIPDSLLDRFLEVAEGISSGWMRARVYDKLPINLIASERVKTSVRKALLEHLLEIKERKREELLWSVDVNLFCSPYIEKETLLKLTNHIHEICDTWNWRLST